MKSIKARTILHFRESDQHHPSSLITSITNTTTSQLYTPRNSRLTTPNQQTNQHPLKMKITAALVALLAGVAIAVPTDGHPGGKGKGGGGGGGSGGGGGGGGGGGAYDPCSGLYNSAQCCATDVLGVADLDCRPRKFLSKTGPHHSS